MHSLSIIGRVVVISFLISSLLAQYKYETKYLDVLVDHFNFVDNRTFPLRYLINDTYWSKDGPIFFYTGNEGNIEVFAANTGFLWEVAVKFQALIIFAEHRYYGHSMPFGNDSLKNPMYYGHLTSEQALADYVDVIYQVKYNRGTKLKIKKKINPVIVFGGSYGGMLAAWIRMKYPAVVEGALAASAPIWQFSGMTSCFSYNQVLTSAFNASSPVCVQNIRKSWDVIVKDPLAVNYLNSNWNLCKPMTDEDSTKFMGWLTDIYSNLAMTNYPYPTNFLTPLPAYPVKEFCSHFNWKITDNRKLLQSLFRAINVYMNHTGTVKCIDWEEDPAAQLGAAGWNIQACTEMVMPICSNGVTDMFLPETWNLKKYSDICYKNFRVRPREFMAEKQYGGKNLDKASNIIFSNGLLDPWSSGGVVHSVSDSTVVVLIPEAAHHLDLRASNPNDPYSVTQARQLYKNIFKRWIREYRKKFRSSYNEYDKYLSTL